MPHPLDNTWLCRSCNTTIFLAKHWRTGNKMVFNAEPAAPDTDGAWCIKDQKAVIARTTQDNPRYLSHHATCPKAASWRKKKRS